MLHWQCDETGKCEKTIALKGHGGSQSIGRDKSLNN